MPEFRYPIFTESDLKDAKVISAKVEEDFGVPRVWTITLQKGSKKFEISAPTDDGDSISMGYAQPLIIDFPEEIVG